MKQDVSSYSYDSTALELVSYDTPNIATLKAKYVQANNLAGSMFWDVRGLILPSIPCIYLTTLI
jgi:GH18 family chitinase